MKIKAKFKGSNSLGYENGKNYNLDFTTHYTDALSLKGQIYIEPLDNEGVRCIYNSLKSFLNNWQVF